MDENTKKENTKLAEMDKTINCIKKLPKSIKLLCMNSYKKSMTNKSNNNIFTNKQYFNKSNTRNCLMGKENKSLVASLL